LEYFLSTINFLALLSFFKMKNKKAQGFFLLSFIFIIFVLFLFLSVGSLIEKEYFDSFFFALISLGIIRMGWFLA
jgi:hypothetical protein